MADHIFEDPRLAALYDPLDPDRSDLSGYVALMAELGARSVLDVGCGTGTFACLLAARGYDVTAVDPAAASLAIARSKPSASAVRWLRGEATSAGLSRRSVDVAVMTGNVAQVFLTDDAWRATLVAVREALRPGGRLVFETRDPGQAAWRRWTREHTHAVTTVDGAIVESWCDLIDVAGDQVTFRWHYGFADGAELASDSTLRFRSRAEIESSLELAGYVVEEVRDAPDRPGLEWVFVARSTAG